jgi:hypothetical protein
VKEGKDRTIALKLTKKAGLGYRLKTLINDSFLVGKSPKKENQ